MNFKRLWSPFCTTALSMLLLASACTSPDVQKISGSLNAESFGSPVVGVRVVQDGSVIDTGQVDQNGRFTVEVSKGDGYRIEVVTKDGVFPLGGNEVGGLRTTFFEVCIPGDGFDMGEIHPVDPADCEHDPMACDPCSFDPNLCTDPCIENPELCVDPCIENPELCVDPCIENPELCMDPCNGDPNCDICILRPETCWPDNPECPYDDPMCWPDPGECQDSTDPNCFGDDAGIPDEGIPDFGCEG